MCSNDLRQMNTVCVVVTMSFCIFDKYGFLMMLAETAEMQGECGVGAVRLFSVQ